jgi:hypothetical protein
MLDLKKITRYLHLCSFSFLPMMGLDQCQRDVAPMPDNATPVQIRETIAAQKTIGELQDSSCQNKKCPPKVPRLEEAVNQAVSPPKVNCLDGNDPTVREISPTDKPMLPPACDWKTKGEFYTVEDDTGELFKIPEGVTTDIFFTECVDRPDMVDKAFPAPRNPFPPPRKIPQDKKFAKLIEVLKANTKVNCKKRDWRVQNYNPKKYEYGGVYTCKIPPATKRKNSSRLGRPGSLGRCYNYVKMGLLAAGLVVPPNSYPYGANAYQAAGTSGNPGVLEKSGFTNVMSNICASATRCSRNKIPKNAIIVYDGGYYPEGHKKAGQKHPGHIEVKAGPTEYISDFRAMNPYHTYKKGAKILGIYTR